MNIAVVGGGSRCIRLMEILQQHEFYEIKPRIVAVVDIDPQAPGFVAAKQQGIFTTSNYRDLFRLTDINLIIELASNEALFFDILRRKSINVRAISSKTVQLFWEISTLFRRHKKMRQELKESRAKFKMIMNELMQEDVMIINHNYRIADVNKNLLDKLGLQRDEVIDRYCYEVTHRQNAPCSGDKHPCPLLKTLESGQPFQTTHIHLDKNDREKYYSIATYPMLEDGDVIGAIEIARDISRDIGFQKTLMQQEKLASIGRLSAGVAHEINNPLTTILTSAMLAQEELSPEDPAYEELEIISRETLRCRKIVTSLLDFARQTKPDKKMNDINQIVTESVLLTQKQAAFKDITIQSRLAPDIPGQMLDKGQIQQALINLILNAVEATPEGGRISVATTFHEEKKKVLIDVADTGEGINEDDINKIFEPFFTTKDSGTGLGLSLTLGIIEQHGGTIKVKRRQEQGTCFTIHLPLNEVKAK